MMPEMDGYATTAAIRRMPQFAGLPIIALTAKAMKGDREKSIESGASDHVTKPVDNDHLLEVMAHWLEGTAGRSKDAAKNDAGKHTGSDGGATTGKEGRP
jgi:CheY-like chemotaxis protein